MLEFSPAAAPSRSAVARLRGAAAGSTSATLSVAGHGWATDGVAPGGAALALLLVIATVTGALVTGLPALRTSRTGLALALLAGQLLGHTVMCWHSGALHHGDLQLSPAMFAAHLVAAGLATAVIHGTETAYRVSCAALARIVPHLYRGTYGAPVPTGVAPYRAPVVLRILTADAWNTRGPPVRAAL